MARNSAAARTIIEEETPAVEQAPSVEIPFDVKAPVVDISIFPDVKCVRATRADFKPFHAKTLDRTTVTAEDVATIVNLRSVAAELAPDGTMNVALAAIRAQIEKFCAMTVGTRTETVAGYDVQAPAIDSPHTRATIGRVGDEILHQLDEYETERLEKLQHEINKQSEQIRELHTALRIPVFKALWNAWCALWREPHVQRDGADGVARAMGYYRDVYVRSRELPVSVNAVQFHSEALLKTMREIERRGVDMN